MTPQEFSQQWEACRRVLAAQVWTNYPSNVDSDDVLQEAALEAWKYRASYKDDGQPNCFARWSARIVHNVAKQHKKEKPLPALDAFEDTHADPCNRIDDVTSLVNLIEDLPELTEQQKDILHLVADGWTQREIGLQLGINHTTVSREVRRVRPYIKKMLE